MKSIESTRREREEEVKYASVRSKRMSQSERLRVGGGREKEGPDWPFVRPEKRCSVAESPCQRHMMEAKKGEEKCAQEYLFSRESFSLG